MFDRDGDGAIDFKEFSALWNYINEWTKCFRSFDRDNSGNIDKQELTSALTQFGGYFYSDHYWSFSFRIPSFSSVLRPSPYKVRSNSHKQDCFWWLYPALCGPPDPDSQLQGQGHWPRWLHHCPLWRVPQNGYFCQIVNYLLCFYIKVDLFILYFLDHLWLDEHICILLTHQLLTLLY